MGRHNISETGRRFSSEYQPAKRGRRKGSLNRATILRCYLEREQAPEEIIDQILVAVFGKRGMRRMRRKTRANLASYFRGNADGKARASEFTPAARVE